MNRTYQVAGDGFGGERKTQVLEVRGEPSQQSLWRIGQEMLQFLDVTTRWQTDFRQKVYQVGRQLFVGAS